MKSAFLQHGITKAEQSVAKQLAKDSKAGEGEVNPYEGTVIMSSHDNTSRADAKQGIKRSKTVRALEPMQRTLSNSGMAGARHQTDSQLQSTVTEREIPTEKEKNEPFEGYNAGLWSGSDEVEISAPNVSRREHTTLVGQPNNNVDPTFQLSPDRVSPNRDSKGNVVRGGKPLYDFYEGPTMKGSPAKQESDSKAGEKLSDEEFMRQYERGLHSGSKEISITPKKEFTSERRDEVITHAKPGAYTFVKRHAGPTGTTPKRDSHDPKGSDSQHYAISYDPFTSTPERKVETDYYTKGPVETSYHNIYMNKNDMRVQRQPMEAREIVTTNIGKGLNRYKHLADLKKSMNLMKGSPAKQKTYNSVNEWDRAENSTKSRVKRKAAAAKMKGSPAKQGIAGGGIRGKFEKTEGGKKHWSKKGK